MATSIFFTELHMFLQVGYIPRWCHDIGREQAANIPLLKIVFQVSFIFIHLI